MVNSLGTTSYTWDFEIARFLSVSTQRGVITLSTFIELELPFAF